MVPVDGPAFVAPLVEIDRQGELTFGRPGAQRRLKLEEFVRFGTWHELARGPLVVLADGGILAAEVLSLDQRTVAVDWRLAGEIHLARDAVRALALRTPADRLRREQWLDTLAHSPATPYPPVADQLILVNGDRWTGTLHAVADRKVRFSTTLGPTEIELKRVRALVFHPGLLQPGESRGPRLVAGFRDGSRLVLASLRIEGNALEGRTAGGLAIRTPASALVALEPLGGPVTYLSDLEPAEYRHVPYLELSWPFRKDRHVEGGWLRAGGRLYLKGLGVHSACRLTYRLERPYRRFAAELAIDDHAGGRGSVGFRIFVDGQLRYTSPPIRGGEAPVPVVVDLAGAKRLDLVVDYGEEADVRDLADWLEARLVR